MRECGKSAYVFSCYAHFDKSILGLIARDVWDTRCAARCSIPPPQKHDNAVPVSQCAPGRLATVKVLDENERLIGNRQTVPCRGVLNDSRA